MYSEADYAAAAARYDVPVPAVKAVVEVEASGEGFLPDGRPKILFEAHHFGKRTGYQFNGSHPRVSVRSWDEAKLLYVGGAGEYDRLAEAKALNETAALESASWGAGQVMGFNARDLDFPNVQAFVEHVQTAAGQMDVMMRYCKRNGLLQHMRRFPAMDACRAFASGYNGSGAIDVYAPKIKAAFLKHNSTVTAVGAGGSLAGSGGGGALERAVLRRGDQGEDVKALQRALGIRPDSDFGAQTEQAVRLFQADQGLVVDGIAGPKTRAALLPQT